MEQAIRNDLAGFRAELVDGDSFTSFIMDCLDAATASPQEINWTDPRQTAQVYERILNDPRLSMA
jgi:hypothetical protein